MKFNPLLAILATFLTVGYSLFAQEAQAFSIVSEAATINLESQQATFTIEFDHVPDFSTVDEYGRAAHSFQYYINLENDGSAIDYNLLDVLIRGEEMNQAGEMPIRNAFPSDETDPNSGGWGTIRGLVPVSINQNIMTFTVPFAMLGESDGEFMYDVETYEYGMIVSHQRDRHSQIINQPVETPEPKAILGLIGVTLAGSIASRKIKLRKFMARF